MAARQRALKRKSGAPQRATGKKAGGKIVAAIVAALLH
jgi:hypothetical protein